MHKVLYRPLTTGDVLSLAGIASFLIAVVGVLVDGAVSPATGASYWPDDASGFFSAAGWFVLSGWLLQRCEVGFWPFREGRRARPERVPTGVKRARPQGDLLARMFAILIALMIIFSLLIGFVFGP